MRRAIAAARGPVILADIADSGAGGTADDATVTFKTLLDMGARNAAVCSISDQEAIDLCLAAGVGAAAQPSQPPSMPPCSSFSSAP